MTDEIVAEFKPSRWGLLWRPVLIVVIWAFIFASINYRDTSSPWWSVVFFAVYAAFLLFVVFSTRPNSKDAVIAINKHKISGPPTKGGRPTVIPIGDVEIALSRHLQDGFDALAGRRWLYSTESKKIMVLCDGFPKGTFEQILDTIVRLQREAVTSEQAAQG